MQEEYTDLIEKTYSWEDEASKLVVISCGKEGWESRSPWVVNVVVLGGRVRCFEERLPVIDLGERRTMGDGVLEKHAPSAKACLVL